MRFVMRLDERGRTTIPARYREALGLEPGDFLAVEAEKSSKEIVWKIKKMVEEGDEK